jgi:hypothetical protein
MNENIGASRHLAVPTRGQTAVHDGPYADRCPECRQVVSRLARTFRLFGRSVPLGSMVRMVPQATPHGHAEWVTLAELRVNSHLGKVWLHTWDWGVSLDRLAEWISAVSAADYRIAPPPHKDAGCPDGGACGHFCGSGSCWRTQNAGPLPDVFPGDDWPPDVLEDNSALSEGVIG